MDKVVKVAVVLSVAWSLVIGIGLFLILAFIGAINKGQMIGGGGWQPEHTRFFYLCLFLEGVNLLALWGAFRLRLWACILLSVASIVFIITYLLLPDRGQVFAMFAALFLWPSCVVSLLLWGTWKRLQPTF